MCPHQMEAILPPTIPEWIRKVNHIASMEELIHQSRDSSRVFLDKWSCWFHFMNSAEYGTLMES